MTEANLRRGNKLLDEIKELNRVRDHFSKFPKEKGIEFLTNFLTRCHNLGDSALKEELSALMIEHTKKVLATRVDTLSKELDAL